MLAKSFTWNAMELQKAKRILKGSLALYPLCAQSLWAPAVIPKADAWYMTTAEEENEYILELWHAW